jgi:NlpC/P60 family putative phage cell wall peptidase
MTAQSPIVVAARAWIGTPYLHQASLRGAGCDCLGLLRGVWRELHGPEPEALPAYSPDWGEAGRIEVLAQGAARWLRPRPPGVAAAGDVLLFRMRAGAVAKHLGIAAETGPRATFIHAYSGHGVVETALSDPWLRKICARFHFPEGA